MKSQISVIQTTGSKHLKFDLKENFESSNEPNRVEASALRPRPDLNVYSSPEKHRGRISSSRERRLLTKGNSVISQMVETHCKGIKLLWKKGNLGKKKRIKWDVINFNFLTRPFKFTL